MATVREIAGYLEERVPSSLKLDFDNVGLLCGFPEREVSRVLVVLDITQQAIEEALSLHAELIVSHHPVIFTPLRRVCTDTPDAKRVIALLQGNLSAICLHTNLDALEGGVNTALANAVGGEELENAYATGRGKIRVRANISLETDGAKRSIVIKEIPYQVNKANLLKKIADLKEDKKEEAFADIAEVVDESDRTGMRAVVRLKKDADANKICALLLKYTDLETTFGINMVAIAGGKPKQMGLLEILSYYINYQREVILRRSKYDLERAKERAHILEGLIIAVLNIDEVVRIIKNSANTPEARQNLRARFQLSEIQANAVLDLRLARLTRLEITKLQEELEQLRRLIKELTAIIGSKKLQMEVVKTELTEIKKKYKNARRTGIGGAAEFIKKRGFVLCVIQAKYESFSFSEKTVQANWSAKCVSARLIA